MRFFFIVGLLTLVTAKVNDLKSHFLHAAKRDMIPSLMWASRQVESLVPVWIDVQVLKLHKGTVQTCLIEFGIIVLKELEPGLEKSCTALLQKHPLNTRFTREEMADFFVMLNQEWSMALKRSLEIWVNRELDSLMGIFAKKFSTVGMEILGKLGRALNAFRSNRARFANPKKDLFKEIKSASKDVAAASLTFLKGSGWTTRELRKFENLTTDQSLDLLDFDFE